jgi:hypothetical protein
MWVLEVCTFALKHKSQLLLTCIDNAQLKVSNKHAAQLEHHLTLIRNELGNLISCKAFLYEQ